MKSTRLKFILSLVCILCCQVVFAQQWVDTLYNFQLTPDVVYGSAVDVAGNNRSLTMDVCIPMNDTPPPCGRPLIITVHGGSFLAGTKDDAIPQQWMQDFAKRGYASASVNYRLGMFQTSDYINCNISQWFNAPWNCSNMTDTLEWYRGWYRAVQDVKGAIRFLVANANNYNIDPRNIFIVGESAGGFIAMGVAFLDDDSEKPFAANEQITVASPNTLYESQCVQGLGVDTSIALMNLSRPDLGSIAGTLNINTNNFELKGVGNFYGGMFYNLFAVNHYVTPPALYMFHQPNDLIVPYQHDRVLAGYAYCATFLGCQYVVNRPYLYGSAGMRDLINAQSSLGNSVPYYLFDSTFNSADCSLQVADPTTGGHQPDDYNVRTLHMAELFASRIDTSGTCIASVGSSLNNSVAVVVFPNPVNDVLYAQTNMKGDVEFEIVDAFGRCLRHSDFNILSPIDLHDLTSGVYLLRIKSKATVASTRFTCIKM